MSLTLSGICKKTVVGSSNLVFRMQRSCSTQPAFEPHCLKCVTEVTCGETTTCLKTVVDGTKGLAPYHVLSLKQIHFCQQNFVQIMRWSQR